MGNFFKKLIANWGTDKWAHMGLGAMICAALTIVLAMQDGAVGWQWPLYTITGWVVTFFAALAKEYVVDAEINWWDILATMFGAAIITLATVIGAAFYTLST